MFRAEPVVLTEVSPTDFGWRSALSAAVTRLFSSAAFSR